jgi:hypothetical protein
VIVETVDSLSSEEDLAFGGPLQNDQVFHKNRFATAALPDDDRRFALFNRCGYIIQRHPLAENLRQIFGYQNSLLRMNFASDQSFPS